MVVRPADRSAFRLLNHRPGAPLLRLGLGPALAPVGAMEQLSLLLEDHTHWAGGRSDRQLHRMLKGSQAIASIWMGREMVGFGRATSDGACRAVLWDVVVRESLGGRGLGRWVVETLLATEPVARAERVYLMTTHGMGFYEKIGFRWEQAQKLMLLDRA